MTNIVSSIENKTKILGLEKQKELKDTLFKAIENPHYYKIQKIVTELKVESTGRYFQDFQPFNPENIKNKHALYTLSVLVDLNKGKSGLQVIYPSDKLRIKKNLGNKDTVYRHFNQLKEAGVLTDLYIDEGLTTTYIKDELQKSFLINLDKAKKILELKGEGKPTRNPKKEEARFIKYIESQEGLDQDYNKYCLLTSKYPHKVQEKYVNGLVALTEKHYNLDKLREDYAEVQKDTPEELKAKIEINAKIKNGFLKGMSCRATNSYCSSISNLKPGETEWEQEFRAREHSKTLRKEILKKYNLEEFLDIKSSILRIQKSMKAGKWLNSKIDCYQEILRLAFPNLTKKDIEGLRNSLKVTALSMYFTHTIKAQEGSVRKRLEEANQAKEELINKTGLTLKQVSERLVAAFNTYIGKKLDTEVFYIESKIMVSLVKEVKKITGYKGPVFFVYDSVYFDKDFNWGSLDKEALLEKAFERVAEKKERKENRKEAKEEKRKKERKIKEKKIEKVNIIKEIKGVKDLEITRGITIKRLKIKQRKKTYLNSLVSQCLE